jgi:glycosyltransferase involved in cell wall biosynthesis
MNVPSRATALATPSRHLLVFDLAVASASPAGSCVLAEVQGLADTHRITVVSSQCEAAGHPNVRWLRVPLPARPLVLRYLAFLVAAPVVLAWHRLRGLPPADWTQTTQGQYPGADISYAHYCHRGYLRDAWHASPVRGPRRWLRLANHRFNAWCEARAFGHARCIVVPSKGLARELAAVYPQAAPKLITLPNPISVERFGRRADFDRAGFRAQHGVPDDAVVFAFVALGDFARKGMGLILPALSTLREQGAWLLVVGGRAGEVEQTRREAERHGIADRVCFVGLQPEVPPFLWASDALVFPSAYEIFSLVTLQAAAAGLPLIVSRGLHGAEEVLVDGETGFAVERDPQAVADAMRAIAEDPAAAAEMGRRAAVRVQRYSTPAFVARWQRLFAEFEATGSGPAPAHADRPGA